MTNQPQPAPLRTSADRTNDALLDANALEFFARIASVESFAAAARKMGLTRAAVSHRVAQIEAQTGKPLFVRHARALGLTEAGRRLLVQARPVMDAVDAAHRSQRRRSDELEGTLRVTTSPIVAQALLAPLLAAFQQRHADVRIELRITARRIDLVREQVDVAFRMSRETPQDCVVQSLLAYAVRAYAAPSPQWPYREPQALAGARCLLYGRTTETARLPWVEDATGRRETVALPAAIATDDLPTLRAIARAGGGVVLLPDFFARDDLAHGTLVEALPGWQVPIPEGDTIQAVTLPLPQAPASARALVRFVQSALEPKRRRR